MSRAADSRLPETAPGALTTPSGTAAEPSGTAATTSGTAAAASGSQNRTDPSSPLDDDLLRAAIDLLEGADTVTVLCHRQPDPDTLGSGMALARVLDRRGADVRVGFDGPFDLPESMRTMPGREFLGPASELLPEVDLVVTVDCGGRDRLGPLTDLFDRATATLVIDHHRSNTRFGKVNLVDPAAVATTAVLVDLFDRWDIPLDADLAMPLYAGLVSDTGSFKWATPDSHLLARRLLATGIDGPEITRALLDTHPFAWLPMLSSVLATARFLPDVGGFGLVYAAVSLDDARRVGAPEVESVIDVVRTVGEADVAAVFKETTDGWSVSLRSRAHVDVAAVAVDLGGGGHRHAAGYSCRGDFPRVLKALVDRLA